MTTYCYTLAPVAHVPEAFEFEAARAITIGEWYRFGHRLKDVAPAYLVIHQGVDPASLYLGVDLSETQIIYIDPESETPAELQALKAIGPVLFDPAATGAIVMQQSIGDPLCRTAAFRLIDFPYEDSVEGKKALKADCLEATGIDLDLRKSLTDLQAIVWNVLKEALKV